MFGITTSREPIKGEFAKKIREAVENMTTSTAHKTFQSKTAKRKHIVHTQMGMQEFCAKVHCDFRRTTKAEQQKEYIKKEELLDSIREGLYEVKHRHTTGAQGITLQEFINEL